MQEQSKRISTKRAGSVKQARTVARRDEIERKGETRVSEKGPVAVIELAS